MTLLASACSRTNAQSLTIRGLLLVAGLATSTFGQFRDWQTGNGAWSANFSWFPIGMPLPTDIARIGIHAGAANSTVTLDQSDTVAGLQVTDGMTLELGGSQLIVNGSTLISGSNSPGKSWYQSQIIVEPGLAASELHVQDVAIQDDGLLRIVDNAVARVDGEVTLDAAGRLGGEGTVNFTSNGVRALNNNGRISFLSGDLTLNQQGTARLDLDGSGGTGWLMMNWLAEFVFTVNGTSLTDAFSGEIHMAAGCSLNMNLDDPWEADASSVISAYGHDNPYPQGMRIDGAPVTLSGEVNLTGNSALLRMLADAEVSSTATFEMNEGCHLRFEGDTDINGGSFTSATGDMADGGVTFAGPTSWGGTVTIDGAARQNADASVLFATAINAVEFDMDGGGGVSPSTWNINQALAVNAERIDQDGSGGSAGTFNGTMNIAGGFLGGLTVNIPEPGFYWTMAGEMNLTGDPIFFMTRVAGSRMLVSGDMNVVSGKVNINSGLMLQTSGQVTIPANAILRCSGDTTVSAATFLSTGVLQNGPSGEMGFTNNVDLDQIGLVNEGFLNLSGQHTLAFVDRFQQTDEGELRITIGGYAPGVEHDLLVVTDGSAQLDGQLSVRMPASGGPQFYPQPGDEFTIITADTGIVGTFDADPTTIIQDLTFQWEVDYNAFDVRLHLVSVTPACPGDANGDGVVNGLDLSVLLSQFGSSVEPWSGADLNGDGQVIGLDLSVLLANFGNECFSIGRS